MDLRRRQLLGGLIPYVKQDGPIGPKSQKEGMVVGEYPLGVDGKSDGV